jgi:hypothetical protein
LAVTGIQVDECWRANAVDARVGTPQAFSARRTLPMRLITSIALLAISVLSVLPAFADRQVTEEERAKLSTAVQTEGCSGGKFEMDEDDQQFEVDDAVCADGKKYDLKFDMQMRLKRKNLD